MTDAIPPWASEEAVVRPHDAGLIAKAGIERARLATLLEPWLVDGVEHVGSTAVPGLAAKPIMDLMASVDDPDTVVAQAGERLAADGWCYVRPELDQRRWRRFFVKPDTSGQRRTAHLHVIKVGHPRWSQQIAFRDALRHDDELARQYGDLKRRLAARHADDREAYGRAKTTFITDTLGRLSR
jgi:GrpB-like predicted nucleotidyltransferase (UPF0157 family)